MHSIASQRTSISKIFSEEPVPRKARCLQSWWVLSYPYYHCIRYLYHKILHPPLAQGLAFSSQNTDNALDWNPPTMSEVRDTTITISHGGTNCSPTPENDTIAWWRPAVCGRNVAINIIVAIVAQTITLNPISFITGFANKSMLAIFKGDRVNGLLGK